MEAALSHPKAKMHLFCAFPPKIGGSRSNMLSFPVRINQPNDSLKKQVLQMMKCAKGDSAEKKLVVENEEEELDIEEEVKKLNEKCRGIGGIVELMECLEREAIMGEDEGREANDYNRRALIFDRSSRVFQALKQREADTSAAAPCV